MRRFYNLLLAWGPVGVLVFAAVESAGIPNPGGTDVLLVAVAAGRPSEAFLCAAMAVIGSLIGSMVFFEVMLRGGEAFLAKRTAGGRGASLRRWFHRYGLVTVFISGLLPIPGLPFKFFVACSGAMCERRLRILAVMTVARVPRYFALAYLGAALGDQSWPWVKSHTWGMVAGAAILATVLFLLIRWLERRNQVQPMPKHLQ